MSDSSNNRRIPWWEKEGGLKFSCLPGCRRCCGGPPGDVFYTKEEEKKIAEHLKMSIPEFRAAYTREYASGRKSLREQSNGDCILLDDNGCSIYSVRPSQCRTYPFWPDVIRTRKAWLEEHKHCPGCGEGKLYNPDEIRKISKNEKETS